MFQHVGKMTQNSLVPRPFFFSSIIIDGWKMWRWLSTLLRFCPFWKCISCCQTNTVTEQKVFQNGSDDSERWTFPQLFLKSKELSVRKLTTILRLLVEAGFVEEKCCEEILKEFGHFYDHILVSASNSFRNINPLCGRLDEFYNENLSNKPDFHYP